MGNHVLVILVLAALFLLFGTKKLRALGNDLDATVSSLRKDPAEENKEKHSEHEHI